MNEEIHRLVELVLHELNRKGDLLLAYLKEYADREREHAADQIIIDAGHCRTSDVGTCVRSQVRQRIKLKTKLWKLDA